MPDHPDGQINEHELISQAQAGSLSAFGTLISAYQTRLYNLAFRLSGCHDDAAELTQETFLKALKAINQFQRKAKFYTWIVRIMVNLTSDRRQRATRETYHLAARANEMLSHSQAARIANAQSPSRSLESHETAEIVRQALETLQTDLKNAIVLREIEQFSYKQIADVMNISEGTVKSRLFRAREAMRNTLAPHIQSD